MQRPYDEPPGGQREQSIGRGNERIREYSSRTSALSRDGSALGTMAPALSSALLLVPLADRGSGKEVYMRRLTAFLVLTLLLVAAPAPTVLGAAEPYTIVATFSLDGILLTDPCPGEDVVLSGSFIGEYHGTAPLGEPPYHGQFTLAYQHVTGTGLTSGTTYVFAGASTYSYQWNGAEEMTLLQNIHLLSQGAGPDVESTLRVHFTIDANGELTSDSYEVSTTCY